MEEMGKEINIWLIIILAWVFSSEFCKVVREWEYKKKRAGKMKAKETGL